MSEGSNGDPGTPDAEVDETTKVEELLEASAAHIAGRSATAEEEAAADGNVPDPQVAEHEREMGKIGAEVKGEGEID